MTVDLSYGRAQFVSKEFKATNTYIYEATLRSTEPQCKDFEIAIKVKEKFSTLFVFVKHTHTHTHIYTHTHTHTCFSQYYCFDFHGLQLKVQIKAGNSVSVVYFCLNVYVLLSKLSIN
jgi:hypothetical protein